MKGAVGVAVPSACAISGINSSVARGKRELLTLNSRMALMSETGIGTERECASLRGVSLQPLLICTLSANFVPVFVGTAGLGVAADARRWCVQRGRTRS